MNAAFAPTESAALRAGSGRGNASRSASHMASHMHRALHATAPASRCPGLATVLCVPLGLPQAAQADPRFLELAARWEAAVERVEGRLGG